MSNGADIDRYVKDPSQLIELCRNVILRLGSGVNQAEIKEKEKLLLELSRMIERLEKSNTPVPEYLRSGKLDLSLSLESLAEANRALNLLAGGFHKIIIELQANHAVGLSISARSKRKDSFRPDVQILHPENNEGWNPISGETTADVDYQSESLGEERLLEGKEAFIGQAYINIKKIIFEINPLAEVILKKAMACFYADGRGLVWIEPHKKDIKLHLRKGPYSDEKNHIKPVGWGGYPELKLSVTDIDFDYVRDLLQQANSN